MNDIEIHINNGKMNISNIDIEHHKKMMQSLYIALGIYDPSINTIDEVKVDNTLESLLKTAYDKIELLHDDLNNKNELLNEMTHKLKRMQKNEENFRKRIEIMSESFGEAVAIMKLIYANPHVSYMARCEKLFEYASEISRYPITDE